MKSTDIIAVFDGTTITTDLKTVFTNLVEGDIRPITRKMVKFFDACDLGPQWGDLASAPAIFIATNIVGEYVFSKDVVFKIGREGKK